jgi:transposase
MNRLCSSIGSNLHRHFLGFLCQCNLSRIPSVPPDTEAVARAAFPKGNIYVLLRNNLGSIYSDVDFAALFSKRGQPAQSPWRLALISVMQFVENLSDRQAAEAVRSRIDWKYALSLLLTDPGFH